jgi:RNA polymerase sigma-70 factor (ECF subfamily)
MSADLPRLKSMMTTPVIPTDAELLQLMLAGDDQAFTSLYRRHQGAVYRFALLMCGSPNIAEEVTQEVFLVLIRQPARYDSARGPLSAYLFGVARNLVLRSLERERPYVPLVEESEDADATHLSDLAAGDDPFGNCTRNEVINLVRRTVLALPPRYREVVVLCDFQEMSYAEAAAVLDCAVGTINSRLHRGRALLLGRLRAAGQLDSSMSDAHRMRCFA